MDKRLAGISKDKLSETITAYLFLAPTIILWLIWFFYPTVQSFFISFQDFNYINPAKNHFVGLGNYVKLFRDTYFYLAFKNSAILVFFVVPLQSFIALVVAIVLNSGIKLRNLFRTIYYVPYVISPIAVATVFMYLFVQDTAIVKFLSIFGLKNVTWFADMDQALAFIAIIYVWQQIGFYMVVYLGGLQTIPAETYESSVIDGATSFKKFIYITLPMLKPVTFFVLTYGMINAFQIFDQVAAVARSSTLGSPAGATSTLVTFLYLQSFRYMEMGYGSASAVVLFLCIFIIALIQKRLTGHDEI